MTERDLLNTVLDKLCPRFLHIIYVCAKTLLEKQTPQEGENA